MSSPHSRYPGGSLLLRQGDSVHLPGSAHDSEDVSTDNSRQAATIRFKKSYGGLQILVNLQVIYYYLYIIPVVGDCDGQRSGELMRIHCTVDTR